MLRECSLLFRLQGSVIKKIWVKILVEVLFSTVIVVIHQNLIEIPEIEATFITVLGLVIGLLLVFRTSTGYERFWEGRKIWDKMTQEIRNLTRLCWLGIKDTNDSRDLIEKRSAINLLIAFAYSTKNYLRHEYAYDADEEIKQLLKHVPKLSPPFEFKSGKNKKKIEKSEKNYVLNLEMNNGGKKKPLSWSKKKKNAEKNAVYYPHDYITPTNIPLELCYYFHMFVNKCIVRDMFLDTDTRRLILISVNELMSCLSQFERILRTPIPLAYSIHLHQAIWLYMLTLPFQLVAKLGYVTILVMAAAAFAFLGILEIGCEIENPFGYDDNDLPLDDFCEVLKVEIQKMTKVKFPTPEEWVYHKENVPFAPFPLLNSNDLSKLTSEEVWNLLIGTNRAKACSNEGIFNEVCDDLRILHF